MHTITKRSMMNKVRKLKFKSPEIKMYLAIANRLAKRKVNVAVWS